MKKIIDKKTGETFMGELWIAEIKNGKRELKVELKTEDDVDRYDVEDAPEEKKCGGRVPKKGDSFWCISPDGYVDVANWEAIKWDKDRFESGSAFWTREEAERELARRKAYVILKEDTKGFVPPKNYDEVKEIRNLRVVYYEVGYDQCSAKLEINSRSCGLYNRGLYFATEEDAQASIKAHEKEWRAWLGVEE